MSSKRRQRKRERYDVSRPDKAGMRKMQEKGLVVWKKRRPI